MSRCPETTPAEFQAAVQAAKDAFPAWRRTPLPTRQRVMFKLQQLIRSHKVPQRRVQAAEAHVTVTGCPQRALRPALPDMQQVRTGTH